MPSLHTMSGPKIEGSTQRVFLVFPTGDSTFPAQFVINLAASINALNEAKIEHEICILAGNCHVDDARNALVRQCRLSECTDFLTIDADMGWEASDLIKILRYEEDVVCGPYRYKDDDEDYPLMLVPNSTININSDKLIEVEGAPTGFMRIKRRILDDLCERHRDHYFFERHHKPGVDLPTVILFERGLFDKKAGARFSGDYRFCQLARDAGYRIWIDPEMYFEHVGLKAWGGRLADHWREKNNIPHPEFISAIRALKRGEETSETFAALVHYWGNIYSMTPEALAAVYHMAREAKGPILETGSGLTTLVLGIAAMKAGVVAHSLEHDLDWLAKTRRGLDTFKIGNVHLWHAPLVEQEDMEGKFVWYDLRPHFQQMPDLDLALIDGPQRRFGRDGVFRFFGGQLETARVIFDDMDGAEGEMFARWCSEHGRKCQVLGEHRKFAISLPYITQISSSAA